MKRFVLPALTFAFIFIFGISCGQSDDQPVNNSVRPADSLLLVTEMIRKDPGNLDLYVRRSKIRMSRKDYPGALADMDRVVAIDSSNSSYLLAAADINFFTGRTQRTEQLLKRAVEVDPKNTDCLLRLAQLYHYFGKYEQELSLINKTLEIDPQNAQAYFMKGMMYKERGDTAKAFSNMQSAIEKDPDYYNAYIQLGLLAAAKNNPVAEDHYLNAIKINPMSEEAHYHLGMYYQQTGRYDKAVVSYDNILRINPEHFDALFNLGVVHNRFLENPDKGIEYFNRAIIVDPKSPRGYYGRGVCYEKKGEKQKAIADYKMALEKDADFTFAALALEKIERLKD